MELIDLLARFHNEVEGVKRTESSDGYIKVISNKTIDTKTKFILYVFSCNLFLNTIG